MSRVQAGVIGVLLALALAGCGQKRNAEPAGNGAAGGSDSLPPAALSERAQRDSVRVAKLVLAYFDDVSHKRLDDARQLFFPESVKVARPDGGIDLEGKSMEVERRLEEDSRNARPLKRIVLLRRAERELLANTFRETWQLRAVANAPDSATITRTIHVLQQLGNDTRWLGRVDPGR